MVDRRPYLFPSFPKGGEEDQEELLVIMPHQKAPSGFASGSKSSLILLLYPLSFQALQLLPMKWRVPIRVALPSFQCVTLNLISLEPSTKCIFSRTGITILQIRRHRLRHIKGFSPAIMCLEVERFRLKSKASPLYFYAFWCILIQQNYRRILCNPLAWWPKAQYMRVNLPFLLWKMVEGFFDDIFRAHGAQTHLNLKFGKNEKYTCNVHLANLKETYSSEKFSKSGHQN